MTRASRPAMLLVVAVSAVGGVARGESTLSASAWVKEGNRALAEGRFDDALEAYRRADLELPQSPEVSFNRGVALYRKGEFDKAQQSFGDALRTRDPKLEASAKFNLGNCAYSIALTKLTDLPGAIEELRKAIAFWRDALELDRSDVAARQNIETAQLLMKDLLDKEKKRREEEQKRQQEQNQDNQTTQPDQQQSEQQQDREQKQGDRQQEQQQPDEQQQPQQDQKQRDGKQDQKKQEDQRKQSSPQERQEQREMSRQDAERMLQAIRDKEQARRDDRRRREVLYGGRVPVERDW